MLSIIQGGVHSSHSKKFRMGKERLSAPQECFLDGGGSCNNSGLVFHIIVEPIGLWLIGALIRFAKSFL